MRAQDGGALVDGVAERGLGFHTARDPCLAYWLPCPVNMNATPRPGRSPPLSSKRPGASPAQRAAASSGLRTTANRRYANGCRPTCERVGDVGQGGVRAAWPGTCAGCRWPRLSASSLLAETTSNCAAREGPPGPGSGASSSDHVRVGAADAERAHAGASRTACPPRQRGRLRVDVEGRGREVDAGIRRAEVQAGRNQPGLRAPAWS